MSTLPPRSCIPTRRGGKIGMEVSGGLVEFKRPRFEAMLMSWRQISCVAE